MLNSKMKLLFRHYQSLDKFLKLQKVLIIYGARRTGKTTILENFLAKTSLKYRSENGDNLRFRQLMQSQDFQALIEYAADYDLIAIDEAQMIPNIGQSLKILIDQVPNLRIIATGSSSFALSQATGEPLTGRKFTLTLYPLSQFELKKQYNNYDLKQRLEEFLLYGQYPEILLAVNKAEKIKLLNELVDSYLLKDIFMLDRVKAAEPILNLLKLLAFQIGQLVSLNELATQLHLDVKTVSRYLDLLQKSFVIYPLGGYSSNLRKEITKKNKYYFVDLGIRNVLISQFNPLTLRDDVGRLWENFMLMEIVKKQNYTDYYGNNYFLRTYDHKEIDLIEEYDSLLYATEFKWLPQQLNKNLNPFWQNNYSQNSIQICHNENYLNFV